jgi:hypothetical protein
MKLEEYLILAIPCLQHFQSILHLRGVCPKKGREESYSEVGPEIKISVDISSCFLVFFFYVFNPKMPEADGLAFHSGPSSYLVIQCVSCLPSLREKGEGKSLSVSYCW